MSETTSLFPCLHGCGTLLPQRGVCADCVNVYCNNLVEAAARGNRCDQCGREHLPQTACVSWAEHCSMRDTLTAQVEALTADLAAVRKVEDWEGARGTRINWVEAPRESQNEWRAWSWGLRATASPRIVARGDTIIALGRALAAQEGAS